MNASECNGSCVAWVAPHFLNASNVSNGSNASSVNEHSIDKLVSFIIEEGFDIEKIIEQLEDYLADVEEVWSEEELDYEVDENGFHSLI